jgi:hypothetical protein
MLYHSIVYLYPIIKKMYLMEMHKPLWNSTFFNFPSNKMRNHLNPLFVRVEIDDDGIKINKVLINGGTTIDLMYGTLTKNLIKTEKDMVPHSTEIVGFNGKTSKSNGVINC